MLLRRRVGFVIRDSRLISNLDVEHNIALPLNYHRLLPAEKVRDRVEHLMEILEIGHLRGARPASLSSEERMRTAIGRSMAVAPEVLLYDNPLAGYSGDIAKQLVVSLAELMDWTASVRPDGRHPTFLCAVTEAQGFALFADRIGRLEQGHVVISPSHEAVDVSADASMKADT
jgi:ABC-type sulfate/molybdate transport systems ATPase subunit